MSVTRFYNIRLFLLVNITFYLYFSEYKNIIHNSKIVMTYIITQYLLNICYIFIYLIKEILNEKLISSLISAYIIL